MIFHHRVDTAWGPAWLEWNEEGLLRSYLPGPCQPVGQHAGLPPWLAPCAHWLEAFFQGQPAPPPDFRPVRSQCSQAEWLVYEQTQAIPPGQVKTYGQIAELCGRPGAAQWVGQALGSNPWPPFVPCHRVIGSNGRMTGFSAPGGVDSKRRLLDMESGREQGQLFEGS
ncbi:MGMT family protein [bacterium]|nr:MGMT family protein [bacterium]